MVINNSEDPVPDFSFDFFKGYIESRPPKDWSGYAVVAFVDLLGFSIRLLETWNQKNGALKQLLQIKTSMTTTMTAEFKVGESVPRQPWVTLFSDSIIIMHPVVETSAGSDIADAFSVVASEVAFAGECAAEAGFGIRGGIEYGPMVWVDHEPIGPAFIQAHALETKVRTARVGAGPMLLSALQQSKDPFCEDRIQEALYLCEDGIAALRPAVNMKETLEALRRAAPEDVKGKYDEILTVALNTDEHIAHLESGAKFDLGEAAVAAHRLISLK